MYSMFNIRRTTLSAKHLIATPLSAFRSFVRQTIQNVLENEIVMQAKKRNKKIAIENST